MNPDGGHVETVDADVPRTRDLLRRAAGLLVVIVILGLVVSVLPGLDEVRERFASAEPAWLAVTFVSAFASTLSYVAAVRGTLSRRLPWRGAWNLGMAEQGSNVLLPTGGVGGPALGAVVLRRAGVPVRFAAPRSAALFLLTSLASFAALIVFGTLTGAGVLPGSPGWLGTWLPAALAALVVAGMAEVGRLPHPDAEEGRNKLTRAFARLATLLRAGVRESGRLLRGGDPLVIGGCIGFLGFDVAALGAGFQAFGGGGPPLGAFVLAYVLGQAGALIPTPGGLGGTEGGLIGMLALYGAPVALATAAVLAYRVFQLGLPAILGLVAFSRIRTRLQDDRETARVAAAFERSDPRV